MKQNSAATTMPIRADGTTTSSTVRNRPQPRLCAASINERSMYIKLNSCSKTTNGRHSVK
ncbi:hypothetical protein D3C85_918390 [compost metagenome]